MKPPENGFPKIGKKSAPGDAWAAETRTAMDSLNQGRGPLPPGPDDPQVNELLAHWDELPEEGLANLTAHRVHGPRLEMLRAADDWLEGQIVTGGDCPSAEALYDFAKGPGYAVLERGQQDNVLDHLTECSECAALVDSLESSPPVPLDWAPAGGGRIATETDPSLSSSPTPRRYRQPIPGRTPIQILRRWAPIAASLAALAGGLMFFQGENSAPGLPSYPLLRGSAPGSLLFPRGPVLLAIGDQALLFEVNPVPEAQGYTVILRAHAGGAFAEGSLVTQLAGNTPNLPLDQTLPVGHYTWEARAMVNGLEQPLGERDFEVRQNEAFLQELNGQKARKRIRSLHAAGYLTDARALARLLPSGSERDSYLGSNPGR